MESLSNIDEYNLKRKCYAKTTPKEKILLYYNLIQKYNDFNVSLDELFRLSWCI